MVLDQLAECINRCLQTALRHVEPPEMISPNGQRRLQVEGAHQMLDSGFPLTLFEIREPKGLVRLGKLRVQPNGSLDLFNASRRLSLLQIRTAQVKTGARQGGIKAY